MNLLETNPTLKKIQQAQPVNDLDLETLCSMVLTQNPDVNLALLKEFYPETAMSLSLMDTIGSLYRSQNAPYSALFEVTNHALFFLLFQVAVYHSHFDSVDSNIKHV